MAKAPALEAGNRGFESSHPDQFFMIGDVATEFLRESNAIEGVFDEGALKQALYAWLYIIGEEKLTTGAVLKTHKILMLNQPLTPDLRGYFRRFGVRIGARYGKPWKRVPELMAQWVENNKGKKTEEEIKQLHIDYEMIHPFADGNGRTGRIFMNWLRLKNGFDILVIKESEKSKYYKWFQ